MHESAFELMKRLLAKYGTPGKFRVLDVGSAVVSCTKAPNYPDGPMKDTGHGALCLPGWQYEGLDIGPAPNVNIAAEHLYRWPVESGTYDLTISGQCMEHVPDLRAWMDEVFRVTKLGGLTIHVAPSSGPFHRFPVHCWHILPDGMRYLLEQSGFEVLEADMHQAVPHNDCWGVGRKPRTTARPCIKYEYPRIAAEYKKACYTVGDINEHIETLFWLAMECDSVVEGGVRYVVSSWAFILGCACRGGGVHSYCWNMLPEIRRALDICAADRVRWSFHECDWLKREVPECDLLFIDTNHNYDQLKEELRLHGRKARKYIVLHDTTRFADTSQDGSKPGLWQAVEELLAEGQWSLKERFTNNNGLTVLERVP